MRPCDPPGMSSSASFPSAPSFGCAPIGFRSRSSGILPLICLSRSMTRTDGKPIGNCFARNRGGLNEVCVLAPAAHGTTPVGWGPPSAETCQPAHSRPAAEQHAYQHPSQRAPPPCGTQRRALTRLATQKVHSQRITPTTGSTPTIQTTKHRCPPSYGRTTAATWQRPRCNILSRTQQDFIRSSVGRSVGAGSGAADRMHRWSVAAEV